MKHLTKIVFLSSGMILSGCADLTHFNTSRTIPTANSEAKLTYIDAKQRVVISAPVTRTVTTRSADGTVTSTPETKLTFCSEPSPDALSALATSGGGNLSTADKLALGGQFAFSEGVAGIDADPVAVKALYAKAAAAKFQPAQAMLTKSEDKTAAVAQAEAEAKREAQASRALHWQYAGSGELKVFKA